VAIKENMQQPCYCLRSRSTAFSASEVFDQTMTEDANMTKKIKYRFQDIAARIIQNIRSEAESEAHQILRSYPGNENPTDASQSAAKIYGISTQSSTGVIYVMDRATQRGFTYGNSEWGKSDSRMQALYVYEC
jgi:hypothetical protein